MSLDTDGSTVTVTGNNGIISVDAYSYSNVVNVSGNNSTVSVQAVVLIVIWRRQRPSWMTSGSGRLQRLR